MTENVLEFKNVNFTYRNSKKVAIKNASFKIKQGDWVAVIGRNGSGKSTLAKLINGLLLADPDKSSFIKVDGEKLNSDSVWDVRDKVGIVFQNPDNQFVGATVADDVAFGLENRGVQRKEMLKIVSREIAAVGMTQYAHAEPSNLSGGQKQRVAIAGILAIRPKIIIFDEATSMLDPEGRRQILGLARQLQQREGLTVISITHDVEEAVLADEILVLNNGKIAGQGSPNEIFSQTGLVEKIGDNLPFIYALRQDLQKKGIVIGLKGLTEEKMVKELCRLNSSM